MPYTPVSILPAAPSRQDDGATFSTKADTWVAALPNWTTDVNSAGAYIDAVGVQVDLDKTAAETARTGAETAQGLAEAAQAGAELAKTGAETAETNAYNYIATIPAGTLNDAIITTTNTWSSQKISQEVTNAGTKGSLTASVKTGQESFITLGSSVSTPVVSVVKEVPQIGVTNNQWTATVGAGFDFEDFAYAAGLTLVSAPDAVANAKYTGKFFDTSGQESTMNAVQFKPDGTKMYTLGPVNDVVYQYTLSTPWDISTASYDSVSFSVSAQDGSPADLVFKPDGTKMYMLGLSLDIIHQYTLSTPWDLSTASYDSVSFDPTTQDTGPFSIAFKTDGTKMYMAGNTTDTAYQYTLSTPWDISTASYDSVSLVITTNPQGMTFNSTGDTLYIVDNTDQAVHEYSLVVAWDISTAVQEAASLLVSPVDTAPSGIYLKPDDKTFFISGTSFDNIYEFRMATYTATLSTGSFSASDVGRVITDGTGVALLKETGGLSEILTEFDSYDVLIPSGSWSLHGLRVDSGDIKVTAYNQWGNISDATYDSVTSLSISNGRGLQFTDDGLKMYTVLTGNLLAQYALSTPWDISTASTNGSFSISSQDTSPRDLHISTDGTKVYMVGRTTNSVYQYTLSTPWDISTASYDSVNLSIATQESEVFGLSFKPDGTRMYITGENGKAIFQYNLSTAWDLSTASYSGVSFSFAAQIPTNSRNHTFKADGTRAFVLDYLNKRFYQFDFSTPWDLSTGSYGGVFYLFTQDTQPTGLAFKPDGTKMYVLGQTNDRAYQFSLDTSVSVFTSDYYSAITNITGQVNTDYWTDLNSMVVSDSPLNQEIYYALSVDDKSTFVVVSQGLGERPVVRDNAGTWEYNSNVTYGSTTWTAASENTVYGALVEAVAVASNQMTSADLSAALPSDFPALGSSLDLAVTMRTTVSYEAPSYSGTAIDYDGNITWEGAIQGTDYNFDAPAEDVVRITALADNNIKVRVV